MPQRERIRFCLSRRHYLAVGLSGAAVGGAFLNFDKVAPAPWPVRLIFFLSALAFGISIACGIQYFFWLNYAGNQSEKRTQLTMYSPVRQLRKRTKTAPRRLGPPWSKR